MIFSVLYRPRREIQAEYEVSPYYPSAIRFESEIEHPFEQRLYNPLRDRIMAAANRMKGIQAGSINLYLAYIFITLILLLLFGAVSYTHLLRAPRPAWRCGVSRHSRAV